MNGGDQCCQDDQYGGWDVGNDQGYDVITFYCKIFYLFHRTKMLGLKIFLIVVSFISH